MPRILQILNARSKLGYVMSLASFKNSNEWLTCWGVWAILTLCQPLDSFAENNPKDDSISSPTFMYRKSWETVKDTYFDRTFNGQNWDTWEHRYDGKLATVGDAHEAIATMLASLANPKTCLLPLTRALRPQRTIFGAKLPTEGASQIGYIRIATFESPATIVELREALGSLGSCDGLVLDLRDNPGGIFSCATDAVVLFLHKFPRIDRVVDKNFPDEFHIDRNGSLVKRVVEDPKDFVESKLVICTTVDGDGYECHNVCMADAVYAKPLVILINDRTRTAAILFCAALSENGRATLVGSNANADPQLIEKVSRLEDGSGISISVARWKTANGNDFGGQGLAPTWRLTASAKDNWQAKDHGGFRLRLLLQEISKMCSC